MTGGVALNPGAVFTMPSTLTTRTTRSSEPMTSRSRANSTRPVRRAACACRGEVEVGAHLAGDVRPVGSGGPAPRQVHQVAGLHGGGVQPRHRARRGELDAELDQSSFCVHGDIVAHPRDVDRRLVPESGCG